MPGWSQSRSRQTKLAPVMPGERGSGGDDGRDYQTYPSYYGEDEGYGDRGAAPGYGPDPGYGGQSGHPGYAGYPDYPDYPDHSGYPDYPDPDSPTTSYPAVARPSEPYAPPLPPDGYGRDGYRREGPRHREAGSAPAGSAGERSSRDLGRREEAGHGRRKRRRGLPLWQELPLLLVIAFCLAVLVRTFLLQAFYIPSGSMEDTLIAGDRVLVNKVVYNFRDPARGEVVVFQGTDSWAPADTGDENIGMFAKVGRTLGDLVGISRPGEKDFIKRVIGLPGDTVSCCDVEGRVFVNGEPLEEDYVIRNSPLDDGSADGGQDCRSRRFDEVVVQPGQIFVMGDHRQVSQDSRCQGQVPIDNVIGRAFLIVWPNGRWGSLSRPETFNNVPQPVALAGSAGATAGGAVPAEPPGPAHLAFVLPILWSVGGTFRADSARSRLIGRDSGRRLAA